ncbi:hypothetical protein HY469_00825 [Candidatus Roizmanbacteria bacterium]|nr:hypothetical protein [Candidatus Roizmanbacteria bacterium]
MSKESFCQADESVFEVERSDRRNPGGFTAKFNPYNCTADDCPFKKSPEEQNRIRRQYSEPTVSILLGITHMEFPPIVEGKTILDPATGMFDETAARECALESIRTACSTLSKVRSAPTIKPA